MVNQANSSANAEASGESVTSAGRFRLANPALITVLVSFVLVTVFSGGLTLFAFVSGANQSPPFLVAFGKDGISILLAVTGAIVAGWVLSALAGHRVWLQVLICGVVFLVSAWAFGLLALSVFVAGFRH